MSLKMSMQKKEGYLPRIHLTGSIDEHSRIEEVVGSIKEDASLDLSQIDRINSVGLIIWLKSMGQLTKTYRISVDVISYCLATYANQLLDLFGTAPIRACMAPYYCPKCKTNCEVLVSAVEVRAAKGAPPAKQCPKCNAPMDFDEMDQYFEFLRGQA